MGYHSPNLTPAQLAYEAKYQTAGINKPAAAPDEQLMQDFEACRVASFELRKALGDRDFNHFWAQVPAGCSTKQDLTLVQKMLALLEEYGCYDKAIEPFKRFARELLK